MFHYVYVLRSTLDRKFYVGSTSDLENRLKRHQMGLVPATKRRLPLELIFYEAHRNKFDVLRREDYLKSTKGKRALKLMLTEYINGRP